MTSLAASKGRLTGVEVARGLACFLVVLFHGHVVLSDTAYPGFVILGNAFIFGRAGVDFFFVLSGFIIFYIHEKDLGNPQRVALYSKRRFIRIYPVYWVVCALIIPIYLFFSFTGKGYERSPEVILKSLVLWPQAHPPIVEVAWTLCYEILFYVLFALGIYNKKLGGALVVLMLCGVCVQEFAQQEFPWSFLFSVHNLQFLLGILVARTLRFPMSTTLLRWLFLASIGMFGITAWFRVHTNSLPASLNAVLYGAASAGILAVVARRDLREPLKLPVGLRFLGQASYSLYLVHYTAMQMGAKILIGWRLNQNLDPTLAFPLLVLLGLLAGGLFHLLVEKPLLKLSGKLLL